MFFLIGREKERQAFGEVLSSGEAEFVAVYGRRRVGKTYLIRQFFADKGCLYFQVTGIQKAKMSVQLDAFASELGRVFYDGADLKSATDWLAAFNQLTDLINKQPKSKKIVLFFDELPWLATPKSGLLEALDYIWNRHWVNDPRIKLFICGSSASWISRKILKNKGGFHNRITRRFHIKPFTLREVALFFEAMKFKLTKEQVAHYYMIFGGIPFYLKHIRKNLVITDNVNELFFSEESPLFDEFDDVFDSLFTHSEAYKNLIRIIGHSHEGLDRSSLDVYANEVGSGGALSKRLEDLELAGFIMSYVKYGRKRRGLVYRLSDEYCIFYLKWVSEVKNKLKFDSDNRLWHSFVGTPKYYGWLGYAFENLCYKHIPNIKRALNLPDGSLASPWRYSPRPSSSEKGAQIDLIFERPDNAVVLCEMKYSDKPYVLDKATAKSFDQKKEIFKKQTKTTDQLMFILLAFSGVKENTFLDDVVDLTLSINDFF